MELKINPEYESLPPKLPKKEYEGLKFSIKQDGLYVPITVNPEGVILDGHHRYEACLELGVEPKYEVKTFEDPLLEKKFVIEVNLRRRHLTTLQRIEMAKPLIEIERELSKQRQGMRTDLLETSTKKLEEVGTLKRMAPKIGVSHETLRRGLLVLEKGSEKLKEKVRRGKTSIAYAYQSVRRQEWHNAARVRAYNRPSPLPQGKFTEQELTRHPGAYLKADEGCWRADYFPDRGHIVDLSYAFAMAGNCCFSRLERIKQSRIWSYFYDLPDEDIINYVAKVNSEARERVQYVADQILIMRKDNRERKNRETIFKEKVEELYAKFKQLTVEFTDGTSIPLNLKFLEWNDFCFRRHKKGGRKWIESSLKQNILPTLAKETLGFDKRGHFIEETLLLQKDHSILNVRTCPKISGGTV